MWKPARFLLCLSLLTFWCGCRFFQSSETQIVVKQARSSGKNGPALTAIHSALVEHRITHKLVQFRYQVNVRPLSVSLGRNDYYFSNTPLTWLPSRAETRERAGVIYRDEADPQNPWWYVDGKVSRPIWLPSEDVQRQVNFAMHRSVNLVSVEDFDSTATRLKKGPAHSGVGPMDWNARFHRVHGTDYNPLSAMDVAKMRKLRGE